MEIYVQSRGISHEQGYCWLKLNTKDSQPLVNKPSLVKKYSDLLQIEAPSILLVRENEKLVLLVTGIQVSNRTDYQGRTIRISIAWLGQNSPENEQNLRAIAVRALRSFQGEDSNFQAEIDALVEPDKAEGFRVVNIEAIKADKLAELLKEKLGDNSPEPKNKIGKSERRANTLASELEKCHLPKDKNPVIVVFTGNKELTTLEQFGVWRGLSKLVEQEKWEEQDIQRALNNINSKFLVIAISLIAFLIFLYLFLSQPQPKPKTETQLHTQPEVQLVKPVQSSLPSNQLPQNTVNSTPRLSEIQTPRQQVIAPTEITTQLRQENVNTSNSALKQETTTEPNSTGTTEVVNQNSATSIELE